MKRIKFELMDDKNNCFPEYMYAEIALLGDGIEDYLQAFKSFLIACSFTEETVSEITTKEEAFFSFQNENSPLTDDL